MANTPATLCAQPEAIDAETDHWGRIEGQHLADKQPVDVALVEHPEHDVDGEQRVCDENRLIVERLLRNLRGALKVAFV